MLHLVDEFIIINMIEHPNIIKAISLIKIIQSRLGRIHCFPSVFNAENFRIFNTENLWKKILKNTIVFFFHIFPPFNFFL